MEQAVELCLEAAQKMNGGEIFIRNMGACDILTLAKAYIGKDNKVDYEVIGPKPGEKKFEELVTDVESLRTVLVDDTYIICPELSDSWPEEITNGLKKYKNLKTINKALRSDTECMGIKDVEHLIRSASL